MIILIILILLCSNTFVSADDEEFDENNIDFPEIVMASSNSSQEPNINSRAAIVYDRNSGEIIYGKKETEKRKMASTTKIMTAMIVIENANLADTVIASQKAAGTGGSRVGLKAGDKVSVNDLLYGLMLCSGNDAAVCLAEYVGGSVEGFSELMNNKAAELNLSNTHFITPHGLDNDEHYTTAYELAKLTDYALKNKAFLNIVGTKAYTITINGRQKNISNTNELLGNFGGVYGVKTGFTNGANRCLVTACKRDSLDIITIVLGADTKKFRTQDSVKLLNYAFGNFEDIDVKKQIFDEFENWKQQYEKDIYVDKGIKNNIESTIEIPESTIITIRKTQKDKINTSINALYNIQAPVEEKQIIGSLVLKCDNEVKMQINIVNNENIKKKNILNYMHIFLNKYV